MAHPLQMVPEQSALLVIDMQTRLLDKIPVAQALVSNIAFLIDGARLVDVPVFATEQYPKGLGPTTPLLAERLPQRPDKVAFSSYAVPAIVAGFREQKRTQILVSGMETHVCVLHTTFDLLSAGFQVFLPVDALAARFSLDHETALRRLEKAGAILTTCETALFEWIGGASHPKFKQMSSLVQERMKLL